MSKQKGAKQKGFLTLSGSLGETTFVDSMHGARAKEKILINKIKRKGHDDFIIHRIKEQEFKDTVKAAALLRHSIGSLVHSASDKPVIQRLNKEMRKVLGKEGLPSNYKNSIKNENTDLLVGFEFNSKVRLRKVFNVQCKTIVNRITGDVEITLSSFVPSAAIKAPKGTSHFVITSAVSQLDFELLTDKPKVFLSERMAWNAVSTAPIIMHFSTTPESNSPIVIVLGLQFFDDPVPSIPWTSPQKNPLCIIEINKP